MATPPKSDFTTQVIQVKSNTLILNCVRCHKRQTYQLDQIRATHTDRITCSCGQRYRIGRREKRHFLRKRVQLPGALLDTVTHKSLGRIMITDLSVGGAGFVSHEQAVQVGDRFIMDFHLDDEAQSHIQEPIIVRHVREDDRVGAEFVNPDGYNFDLDFYINPLAPGI